MQNIFLTVWLIWQSKLNFMFTKLAPFEFPGSFGLFFCQWWLLWSIVVNGVILHDSIKKDLKPKIMPIIIIWNNLSGSDNKLCHLNFKVLF